VSTVILVLATASRVGGGSRGVEALTQGHTCLTAEQCAKVLAALQRAHEPDPPRPHVAERRAEAVRRRSAASAAAQARDGSARGRPWQE
jgi:hypothetical protein